MGARESWKNLGKLFQSFVERTTGIHVLRQLPDGVSVAHDIRRYFPRLEIRTVFDVGAHKGESTLGYLRCFAGATTYCFEPANSSFTVLRNNVRGQENVQCFNLALGAKSGAAMMRDIAGSSSRNYLLESLDARVVNAHVERVELRTIDEVCRQMQIERINFLKIDTEGHDLDVLRGAEEMLRSQKIDLVQVEAGMNPENKVHIPLESFNKHLGDRGYSLFRFYAQVREWPTGEAQLRRADPVYASGRLLRMSKRGGSSTRRLKRPCSQDRR